MCNACGTPHPSRLARRCNLALYALTAVLSVVPLVQPLLASKSATDTCVGEQSALRSFAAAITADLGHGGGTAQMVAQTRSFASGIGAHCPEAESVAASGVAGVCEPCHTVLSEGS